MRLLFVCVGNTCRSQIAEALARNRGHEAVSAGTDPGDRVAENAIAILEEMGVNSEGLYPKSVDSVDLNGFDKTISMGCGVHCPSIPMDEDWGLEDPVGRDLEFYRGVSNRIMGRLVILETNDTDA